MQRQYFSQLIPSYRLFVLNCFSLAHNIAIIHSRSGAFNASKTLSSLIHPKWTIAPLFSHVAINTRYGQKEFGAERKGKGMPTRDLWSVALET